MNLYIGIKSCGIRDREFNSRGNDHTFHHWHRINVNQQKFSDSFQIQFLLDPLQKKDIDLNVFVSKY